MVKPASDNAAEQEPVQKFAQESQSSESIDRPFDLTGAEVESLGKGLDLTGNEAEERAKGPHHYTPEKGVDLSLPKYNYVAENKPMPPCPGPREDFQIDWIGDNDPDMPLNWSNFTKNFTFILAAFACLMTSFGSAVIGPGTEELQKKWHLGLPVVTLTVSLYVVGFAVGPVIWGPFSEAAGRWMPLTIGTLGLVIFAYACGSAANFQTLVLSRFFAGTFGAANVSVTPAVISDLYETVQRGKAIGGISLLIFAGPMLAPVVGGYISASFLGWRWTQYIWAIGSSLALIMVFFMKETYSPKLLVKRAHQIRVNTGNWTISAPLETNELKPMEIIHKTVLKPIRMLFMEPILFLISLYHGFIYGILYLCLEAVPIVFGNYGWHGGNVYLPYIGMLIGCGVMTVFDLVIIEPRFAKKIAATTLPVLPEERLELMMVAGLCFPIGIFLFTWSGAYHVQWIVPTIGCAFIGAGLIGIFNSAFNYLIDTYLMLAASAISANTFLRSGMGASFPLFAHPLFINLHTQWAGTLLGCLAALLTPVPFLFYVYGKKVRKMSKFAFSLDDDEGADLERITTHLSRHTTNRSMVQM